MTKGVGGQTLILEGVNPFSRGKLYIPSTVARPTDGEMQPWPNVKHTKNMGRTL